jgi:hypothetical protein
MRRQGVKGAIPQLPCSPPHYSGTNTRSKPACILSLMPRNRLIHFAVVLALTLTNCLVVRGMDGTGTTSFGGENASVAVGVVLSPHVLVSRLKSGGELWPLSSSPVDRAPVPTLPTLTRSASADTASRSVVRFFCHTPLGSRPPPQL